MLISLASCSWFDDPPRQRVPVRTTPRVAYFATEAQAKAGCGDDPVVWGNSASLVYHEAGKPGYGKTSYGAFMCRRTAVQGGYHPAANGEK